VYCAYGERGMNRRQEIKKSSANILNIFEKMFDFRDFRVIFSGFEAKIDAV